jgi:TatD DNase family protein
MQLFDSHCHLQDERFRADFSGILARARQAGVAGWVCCGTEEADWADVARLAAEYPGLRPAYGIHPWYLANRSAEWVDGLRRRAESDPSAGVGEIGLDHAIRDRNDEEQRTVFMQQLSLAHELRRPVSIHCRQAWATLIECLRTFGTVPAGFVVHSYSGSPELVTELLPFGGRFSFSGSITYSGNRRARRSLAAVPMDRLLIETDAPDLLPCQVRMGAQAGGADGAPPNEPANLVHVFRTVAELKGMAESVLADQLWANSVELFQGVGIG